jgi:hypothetical protein
MLAVLAEQDVPLLRVEFITLEFVAPDEFPAGQRQRAFGQRRLRTCLDQPTQNTQC